MAIRTFIFCDACNPQGIRTINDGFQYGRRSGDDRAWFEGDIHEAEAAGWVSDPDGHILCPRCRAKGLDNILADKKPNSSKPQAFSTLRKTLSRQLGRGSPIGSP